MLQVIYSLTLTVPLDNFTRTISLLGNGDKRNGSFCKGSKIYKQNCQRMKKTTVKNNLLNYGKNSL